MTPPFTIEEYKQSSLSSERLKFLYEKRWFKMFVPEDYGGLELSLTEGANILTKSAAIQGGMGWVLNLGAGANWFSGFFEDAVARTLFSPVRSVIAGSGFTSGSYEHVESGILINGTWTRCTGAAHATLFSLNAENKKGNIHSFVVPGDQVRLSDDKWPIFGLKNTSSHAIKLENVTVPEEYGFEINKIKNHADYPVFHVPFELFARVCMASSFIGIVKCLVHIVEEDIIHEKTYLAENIKTIKKLMLSSEAKRNELSEELAYSSFNKKLTKRFKNNLKQELGVNNKRLFDEVQILYFNGGLPFAEENQRTHWAYRDVLTGVQHYMVKP